MTGNSGDLEDGPAIGIVYSEVAPASIPEVNFQFIADSKVHIGRFRLLISSSITIIEMIFRLY